MASNESEIVGGPMAHALAWMVQQMQEESGSSDLVLVETDADGNELRRIKLQNAKLLRVKVAEESDVVESELELRFDKPVGGEGDPVRQCAREIVDHVRWKAPEQIDQHVSESLWDMTQALRLDPDAVKLKMQQISREVHNTPKDFNDVDAVERRLRLALGGDDAN